MIISYNLWHTSWSKFLDANNEFVTIWTQLMSYLKKKKNSFTLYFISH